VKFKKRQIYLHIKYYIIFICMFKISSRINILVICVIINCFLFSDYNVIL